MNAQNIDNKPKVQKETKNKIRVEFDRTPLKERLKKKLLSLFFLKKVLWTIFRFAFLLGVTFIILKPFFEKITRSFMKPEDFVDVTVRLVPKSFTLDIYKAIWTEMGYLGAVGKTFFISASLALIQTFVCCFIAYGLAKFKFKGNKLIFGAVLFSLIVPHQVLRASLFYTFRYFDIFGITKLLGGGTIKVLGLFDFTSPISLFPATAKMFTSNGMNLTNTYWPLVVLSLCGLAFKNGLYVFMLRQFFKGVPDELEESAYIDGSGIVRTFLTIILPISVPMMITVFLFAFSWQWTDKFYMDTFFVRRGTSGMLADIISADTPVALMLDHDAGKNEYYSAIRSTSGLMVILPLVIVYCFGQKYLVQGIERSGLTAD
ncbi:MAG: carbohydrate ABC transporter permease [Clostridia bacterium]|nr:carbohydrate ABC transporter permease [Clostridia bacterium]